MHKHYDCIVAWAEGKAIQWRHSDHETWEDCTFNPQWLDEVQYRVKPQERVFDVVSIKISECDGDNITLFPYHKQVKLTLDANNEIKSIEVTK